MTRPLVLYLNTRSLKLERDAELAAARRRGLGIVVAAPSAGPYAGYDLEGVIEAPLGRYDQAERVILAALSERQLAVHAVVAWADREVELAARLAARLGLKGTTESAARLVRNKAAVRRRLTGVPGANPRFALVRNEQDLMTGLRAVGVPSLLKPAGASGRRGQFPITHRAEAVDVFRAFQKHCDPARDDIFGYHRDEALLEELLRGSEHSVAGAVVQGRVCVFAVADKRVDLSLPWEYQSTVPTILPQPVRQRVVALAHDAVEATGIDNCGFHVDVMVGPDGAKILEVGGRLGGECINSHLVELAVPGLEPYAALLEVAEGRDPFTRDDYTAAARRRAAFRHILPPRPGKIRALTGMDRLARHPAVRAIDQVRKVGDDAFHPREVYNAFAVGYLVVESALDDDLDRLCDDLVAEVAVHVD